MRITIGTLIYVAAAMAAGGCDGDGDDGGAPDGPPQEPPCGAGKTAWTSGPDLPLGPTQETAVVGVEGKMYVLGGFNGQFGVISAVQIFDTKTCTWSQGPELPSPVHHINAAVVNGTIYVVGALSGASSFAATGVTWSWKPGDAAWQVLPSMPAGTERGSSITGAIGTTIYVAGGLRNGSLAEMSSFDTVAKTWSTAALPALPSARDHGCGVVVGGKLYAIGGRNSAVVATVLVYEPGGGGWIEKAAMPTARGGVSCDVVGERVIVVGGEWNRAISTGVFPEVEAYSPASDRWDVLPAMKTPRHGMGAYGWQGRLYVPGGGTKEGFGATPVFEILTP